MGGSLVGPYYNGQTGVPEVFNFNLQNEAAHVGLILAFKMHMHYIVGVIVG